MGFQVIQGNEPLPRPGLYVIEHADTGKKYVGVSGNVRTRLQQHANGTGGATHLARALRKYGIEAFISFPAFYLLDGIPVDAYLEQVEAEFIKDYSSTTHGYNILDACSGIGARRTMFADPAFREREIARLRIASSTPAARKKSADGNRKHFQEHPERRVKMAELARTRFTGSGNPNFGKPMPAATKAKLSASKTGRLCGEQHPMFGKHHAEETKKKISEAHKVSAKCKAAAAARVGNRLSAEQVAGMSVWMKGRWVGDDNPMRKEHNKRTCEHCGMRMAVNTFARFHGDKCKKRSGE